MDFQIDGAFAVLKEELTELFKQLGELFTSKSIGPSHLQDWFFWALLFILLGFLLAILRKKGIIPTFNKNVSFEEEIEAEAMSTFSKRLVMKDDLINSELQSIEAKKSKHLVDNLQTMTPEGIRHRSSYFPKMLLTESDFPCKTSSFAENGELESLRAGKSDVVNNTGDKKIEVSLLFDSL